MKKLSTVILGIVIVAGLSGCGKNPCGPGGVHDTLPPVQSHAETFEEHVARLQTPTLTWFWLKEFADYDLTVQNIKKGYHGGYDFRARNMPDLVYGLAHAVWETHLHDDQIGVCGQFAATYAMAAREHGYDAGMIFRYSNEYGHAQGWIVDRDGSVIITDNMDLLEKEYSSKEAFFTAFTNQYINSDDSYGYITNSEGRIIWDQQNGWNEDGWDMW